MGSWWDLKGRDPHARALIWRLDGGGPAFESWLHCCRLLGRTEDRGDYRLTVSRLTGRAPDGSGRGGLVCKGALEL